ncbi:hypothetical protein HanRHA438_Chr04g0189501 [Helianthus annuus]|nr:hypothetical protein HanIR_Chr04g0193511 [Helianthus annuus]KAJ0928026.1 hypothetical protein HanRHA438_Chr04g0189501 [Helianthus annuus]
MGFLYSMTPSRIMYTCIWAKSIWWNVFVWLRLNPPYQFDSLKNMLNELGSNPGSKIWRRLIYTVAAATTWRIWYARNAKAFEDTFIPVNNLLDLIKEDVFLWVCNRAKISSPIWENWINFDVGDIV